MITSCGRVPAAALTERYIDVEAPVARAFDAPVFLTGESVKRHPRRLRCRGRGTGRWSMVVSRNVQDHAMEDAAPS